MVEVFRTNVASRNEANMLVKEIHKSFTQYRANFDLEDCDNILRIESLVGIVEPKPVIWLLQQFGFSAEPLPDEPKVPKMFVGISGLFSGHEDLNDSTRLGPAEIFE